MVLGGGGSAKIRNPSLGRGEAMKSYPWVGHQKLRGGGIKTYVGGHVQLCGADSLKDAWRV